ncbi:MAG: TetR family transcriptional regulator [Candidatus Hinthialibacter antarcticus]|nr:TetR family transcriptional regulator [Candidatus Hinthialibacter antarcticus]
MARKTKEEAQETRKKILRAALDVFSKKGYSKSTFVDIADQIGLTKGAVYWHFKSKEELLIELIYIMLSKEEEQIKEKINEEINIHNLKDYFMTRAQFVLENEECRKFIFFITLQMEWTVEHLSFTHKKIKELRTGFFEETHRVLVEAQEQKLLKKNIDIQQVEDCLISLYMGLVKNDLSGFSSTGLIKNIEFSFDAIIETVLAN